MDTRVQDYLDDKLQSAADLEGLDSLLVNVKAQQDLLRKQVCSQLTSSKVRADTMTARGCQKQPCQRKTKGCNTRSVCPREGSSLSKRAGRYRPETANCHPVRDKRRGSRKV